MLPHFTQTEAALLLTDYQVGTQDGERSCRMHGAPVLATAVP